MKTVANIALILILSGSAAFSAAPASGEILPNDVTALAAEDSSLLATIESVPASLNGSPTFAQDLSVFGVISIGIIGLFWIRRHTSEL